MRPPCARGSHLPPSPSPTHIHYTLGEEAGAPLGPSPGSHSCCRYLAWRTLGPVQRGPLLGLAEVRVVRVAAPQLLTGLKGRELRGKGYGVTRPDWFPSSDKGQRAATERREWWKLGGRRSLSGQSPTHSEAQPSPGASGLQQPLLSPTGYQGGAATAYTPVSLPRLPLGLCH